MSETGSSPEEYFERIAAGRDDGCDIATAALMFAAFDHPQTPLAAYRAHLAELADAAKAEVEFARNAETVAHGLSTLLTTRYGYDGDHMHYDDPDNADLIMVIERRRGLPVALGVLYMHAARGAGLKAQGLAAPGHFLLTVAFAGSEALIDPFNGGAALDRERLTTPPLLSEFGFAAGGRALEPVSDIDVLLRLQNNIKMRALQRRDPSRAVEILRRMSLIAPGRPDLWLEMARLQESLGALSAARTGYENCIARSGGAGTTSNEATLALDALKRRLN